MSVSTAIVRFLLFALIDCPAGGPIWGSEPWLRRGRGTRCRTGPAAGPVGRRGVLGNSGLEDRPPRSAWRPSRTRPGSRTWPEVSHLDERHDDVDLGLPSDAPCPTRELPATTPSGRSGGWPPGKAGLSSCPPRRRPSGWCTGPSFQPGRILASTRRRQSSRTAHLRGESPGLRASVMARTDDWFLAAVGG
jgi:hypothetical protein